MFNVLTDTFKTHIKSDYIRRRIIIWLLGVIAMQIILFVLITPPYMYLVAHYRELLAEQKRDTLNDKINEIKHVVGTISGTNEALSVLAVGANTNSLSDLISKIATLKNSNIRIDRITYKSSTATSSLITLGGVATNRDSLLLFSKRVENDEFFRDLDLPVSNFAKDKNIEFSMEFNATI